MKLLQIPLPTVLSFLWITPTVSLSMLVTNCLLGSLGLVFNSGFYLIHIPVPGCPSWLNLLKGGKDSLFFFVFSEQLAPAPHTQCVWVVPSLCCYSSSSMYCLSPLSKKVSSLLTLIASSQSGPGTLPRPAPASGLAGLRPRSLSQSGGTGQPYDKLPFGNLISPLCKLNQCTT